MGISVMLTTEHGDVLERVEDPTNHLHRVLPSTGEPGPALLEYVDWYGDTIFNRLQMATFLREWSKLKDAAGLDGAEELHSRVTAMAGRCASDAHLYLKFMGD